jgi:hypothetical protein
MQKEQLAYTHNEIFLFLYSHEINSATKQKVPFPTKSTGQVGDLGATENVVAAVISNSRNAFSKSVSH